MDSEKLAQAAAIGVLPRVAKNVGLRWIFFGVAAYYGLKYLHKKGILSKPTGAALGLIDHGVDMAKEKLGLESAKSSPIH